MLIRRTERLASSGAFSADQTSERGLDRRSFLRHSGLAGGLAGLGALSLGAVRKAQAGPPPPAGAGTVCMALAAIADSTVNTPPKTPVRDPASPPPPTLTPPPSVGRRVEAA